MHGIGGDTAILPVLPAAKIGKEFFKGQEVAIFGNFDPLEEIAVIDDDGRKPGRAPTVGFGPYFSKGNQLIDDTQIMAPANCGAINAGIIPFLSRGFIPHDENSFLRDNSVMDKNSLFFDRLDRKLDEIGITDRALSIQANGKPDLIRDARRHKSIPKSDNLLAIANILGVSTDWLLGIDSPEIMSDVRFSEQALDYRPQPPVNDLPVLGTAHGGSIQIQGPSETIEIEQTLFEPTEVIRYVLRPRSLEQSKDAYAIYVEGESMYPRFAPGEMAVIDPRIPPQIGDDVIVQLSQNGSDEISTVLVKRLVRRSASFIELQQFNPLTIFRIDSDQVKRIHRICPAGDLLGG